MGTGRFRAALERVAVSAMGALLLFGCASATPKTALRQDGSHDGGPRGSRSIFLLVQDPQRLDTEGTRKHRGMGVHLRRPPEKQWEFPQRITLAKAVGDRGQTITSVVVPVSARELLAEVLKDKLTAAGYQVRPARELPALNASGITMTVESADLTQRSGFFDYEGQCQLRVKLETWDNGVQVASTRYEAQESDAARQAPDLLRQLLAAAAHEVAERSVQQVLRDLPLPRR